ncbi:hypothetical protein LCGC14_1367480 [marine sediment metagenome]|uniref:Uncharacterized protein n=1 Tax=marine sediment metagenome TaxID=412755 RepID=A0A0F9KSC9_9ZZZZ
MKVFIWEYVARMSDSYHCDGGVVVLAAALARARTLANSNNGCQIQEHEQPSAIFTLQVDHEEKVFYMPNAGCC